MNIELQENQKLHKRRKPIDIYIYHLSFEIGDEKIKTEKLHFSMRDGYSVSCGKDTFSVTINSFDKIFHLNDGGHGWEIYSYEHKYDEALDKLKLAMYRYKVALMQLAESIPVVGPDF